MQSTRRQTDVRRAITRAESILPGRPAPEGKRDPRWQAIIRVGEYIEAEPEAVWQFAERWAKHPQADLRAAIATCLLEHLLEHDFDLIFPRARQAALASVRFADALSMCWYSCKPKDRTRMNRLLAEVGLKRKRRQHEMKRR